MGWDGMGWDGMGWDGSRTEDPHLTSVSEIGLIRYILIMLYTVNSLCVCAVHQWAL